NDIKKFVFSILYSSGPWKALFFSVLICLILGLVGFIIYKYRFKLTGTTWLKVLKDVVFSNIIEALRKYAVHFTIDRQHVYPNLRVSQDGKSMKDAPGYNHTREAFPYKLYAFGAQKYSSGRHYWEVELVRSPNPPKNYWIIGVMKHENVGAKSKPALIPSNGCWFLCSEGQNGFYTSTDQSVKLPLTPRPERLGVLLDYDEGQLSFYNVTERKHLLTISCRFSGSVVPLFNPGAGDQSPITILHCPKPVEPQLIGSDAVRRRTCKRVRNCRLKFLLHVTLCSNRD
uniref:B30.2/SPRY domain-containing protein n=1 Tax=Cyprinus carpio TaxID=7962 RepID=A0A8C2J706_CYPCA